MKKIVTFYNNFEKELSLEVKKSLYKKIKGGYYVYTPLYDIKNEEIVAYRLDDTISSNDELNTVKDIGGFETYKYFGDVVFLDQVDESKIIKSELNLPRDSSELISVIESVYGKNNPNVHIVQIPDNIEWCIEKTFNSHGIVYEYVAEVHQSWNKEWENTETDEYDDLQNNNTNSDYIDNIYSINTKYECDTLKQYIPDKPKSQFVNESVISDILNRFKMYAYGSVNL